MEISLLLLSLIMMGVMLGTDILYDLLKWKVRRSGSKQSTKKTAMTKSEISKNNNLST